MREFKDAITGDSKDDEDRELPAITQARRRASPRREGAEPAATPRARAPPRSRSERHVLTLAVRSSSWRRVLRPVGHEDRLSIVDHLDELRTRLMVCGAALIVAFGICFWQNHPLLNVLNRPLPASPQAPRPTTSAGSDQRLGQGGAGPRLSRRRPSAQLSRSRDLSLPDSALIAAAANRLSAAAKALPQTTPQDVPITIGVGEPFTDDAHRVRLLRAAVHASRCCSTRPTRS